MEKRATGLARVSQGRRGHGLWLEDEYFWSLRWDDEAQRWEAWVARPGALPSVRLKARWEDAPAGLAAAKAALLAAVWEYGKLAGEGP